MINITCERERNIHIDKKKFDITSIQKYIF